MAATDTRGRQKRKAMSAPFNRWTALGPGLACDPQARINRKAFQGLVASLPKQRSGTQPSSPVALRQ